MKDVFSIEEVQKLEEQLALRGALQNITNRINAARDINQILVELKDEILGLFNAEAITIYVTDVPKSEIYSLVMAGTDVKEIRVSINTKSIAGYVAYRRVSVNIGNAYDKKELKSIDKELAFNDTWDKQTGFRTTQVMAVPLLYEDNLMGVIQVINQKDKFKFTEEETSFLEEIAYVLGIAFHNQQRMGGRKKTKFDYLLSQGLIKESDLDTAREEVKKTRQTIEDYLISALKISRDEVGKSFADFYNCKYVKFNPNQMVFENPVKNLRPEFLQRELWIPLEKVDGKIRVLVDNPGDILKRDMIESLLKTKKVIYDVALKEDILKFISAMYQQSGANEQSIGDLLGRLDDEEVVEEEEEGELVSETDSVITQLVNKIINDAYLMRSSDIHVEPNPIDKQVDIRFRIDGDCAHYQSVPYSYRAAIVSRLKIMSNLDITVRRLPQDGKIKFRRPKGEEIELRVATIPTQGNVEDVVMRILAKGDTLPLEAMGMSKRNYDETLKILAKPYGMILVVGPTGSGKTTTLHAALHHINTPDRKIWTAEDPVEITQRGLRQVQVHPKIGFDFATAMRAFLRADPDIIMVGEMRDFETARTGVEASLTGHLVLSTLHTNSAPETIVRLLDMGIDPLNFADALLGILAQRLIRTLCKNCKEVYHPSIEEFDSIVESYGREQFLKLNIPYTDDLTLYSPKGCDQCNQSGYRGRMGIHELLVGTDTIKRSVQKHETVEILREIAMSEGMTTLLQDGILKAIQGVTDFKQVYRVCIK